MLELTNLNWPVTPYGNTGQIIQRPRQLLTGIATLWADDNGLVLAGAAAVFLDVHRTKAVPVTNGLFTFGYRALACQGPEDCEAIRQALDVLLVQARRDAPALAWHAADDDLHCLRVLNPPSPGAIGLDDAWKQRTSPGKGIARCIDTANDLGPAGLLSDTAATHGLPLGPALLPLQSTDHIQQCYEELAAGEGAPAAAQGLAAGALAQALTVALLGGRHAGFLTWETPPSVYDALDGVAWSELPVLFPTNTTA
ncbi:hypothetical protein [Streptomyces sp. WM6378]|uniref:hypothetical protein n=1 Tax=Streptomyces sp. WM6378 TaxID=1415557 RepID=UPI0006AED3B4|nr:hypothetical protein [Streptomyces sp. WM6378]KOU50096.1 hypothetical protein ADK54_10070 [Streptomyces sp. WM6378]